MAPNVIKEDDVAWMNTAPPVTTSSAQLEDGSASRTGSRRPGGSEDIGDGVSSETGALGRLRTGIIVLSDLARPDNQVKEDGHPGYILHLGTLPKSSRVGLDGLKLDNSTRVEPRKRAKSRRGSGSGFRLGCYPRFKLTHILSS